MAEANKRRSEFDITPTLTWALNATDDDDRFFALCVLCDELRKASSKSLGRAIRAVMPLVQCGDRKVGLCIASLVAEHAPTLCADPRWSKRIAAFRAEVELLLLVAETRAERENLDKIFRRLEGSIDLLISAA